MFEKIKQTINVAGEAILEQANHLTDAAKEKGHQIINTWVSVLPKLEAYGFKTSYFAFSMSLNPTLEFELTSNSSAFPLGRVEAILMENTGGTPINIVFNAVKTAILLHQKARIEIIEPMTVTIKVRLSPEVKVAFGKQRIE